MSREGERVEQEAGLALRRWANLHGRLRPQQEIGEPLSVIDIPSGQEFLLEVRAIPMGQADG